LRCAESGVRRCPIPACTATATAARSTCTSTTDDEHVHVERNVGCERSVVDELVIPVAVAWRCDNAAQCRRWRAEHEPQDDDACATGTEGAACSTTALTIDTRLDLVSTVGGSGSATAQSSLLGDIADDARTAAAVEVARSCGPLDAITTLTRAIGATVLYCSSATT
jgi:hypothetical protein